MKKYFIKKLINLAYNLIRKTSYIINRKKNYFIGSRIYWENRYLKGGTSGKGSYNKLAKFKANIINLFITQYQINSVIDFGCGDGNQLQFANYPYYIGLDISKTAISMCKKSMLMIQVNFLN